ncbi:MAG TPA: serine/threonine-protein kinase [Labilithrix sp.]|nr:serine/threonine-protein kinase [Labilithrix sp.]
MSDRKERSPPNVPTMVDASLDAGDGSTSKVTMDGITLHSGGPSSSQQRIVVGYLGKTLEDRYVVESLIGEGGMGSVYLGRHKLIDKRVAIKVLRSDLVANQEMSGRFLNEAKAASSIVSPHIVDISDYGRLPDNTAFFVMEYLDGTSLSSVIASCGMVPVVRLLHIAKQIARGLAAAHARGVVHRDLKPDNVMLITRGEDTDFVKILDFGIAKVGGETARLTRAGSVFGTPHYMSPEQAAGLPVDPRTDIYALGVMLYEMACGIVPFDSDNFAGILTQHMYKAPPPLRSLAPPDVPVGLDAIVAKALSKKKELRYQTMAELALDLEKVERGIVPELRGRFTDFSAPADYFPSSKANPAEDTGADDPVTSGRRRWVLGAMGGILLLGVVGVLLIGSSVQRTTKANATTIQQGPAGDLGPRAPAPRDPPRSVVAKVPVVVTTDPVDATIALDGVDKDVPKQQPRIVEVGPDEVVTVRIERAGYRTATEVIEGKNVDRLDPRVVVRLERERPKGVVPPPPPPKAAAPPSKPAPSANVAPAPAPTARPASCPGEDWDPFLKKCNKH